MEHGLGGPAVAEPRCARAWISATSGGSRSELRDGKTIAIKDRVPLLALARLRPGDEDRVGTPIDVLVSPQGEVAVDWEATLRQPELRPPRG